MRRSRLVAVFLGVAAALMVAQGASAQSYGPNGATDACDTFDGDGDRTTIFSSGGEIQVRGEPGSAAPNARNLEAFLIDGRAVLLARFDAGRDGSYISNVTAVPREHGAGRHNVVVVFPDGSECVQAVTIRGAGGIIPRGLPKTGGEIALLGMWGAVLVIGGGLLIAATWRRWRTAKVGADLHRGGGELEVISADEAQL